MPGLRGSFRIVLQTGNRCLATVRVSLGILLVRSIAHHFAQRVRCCRVPAISSRLVPSGFVCVVVANSHRASEDDGIADDDFSAVFRPDDGRARLDIGNVVFNPRHADEIP
jgi:hypothetical protein